MLDLIAGGSGSLYAIGAVVLGVLAVIWKAFRTGRAIERGKAAKQANKGWVEGNELIDEAIEARLRTGRDADTGGLFDDDGHKRS